MTVFFASLWLNKTLIPVSNDIIWICSCRPALHSFSSIVDIVLKSVLFSSYPEHDC